MVTLARRRQLLNQAMMTFIPTNTTEMMKKLITRTRKDSTRRDQQRRDSTVLE
jgi:hypothetical protein